QRAAIENTPAKPEAASVRQDRVVADGAIANRKRATIENTRAHPVGSWPDGDGVFTNDTVDHCYCAWVVDPTTILKREVTDDPTVIKRQGGFIKYATAKVA